MGFLRRLANARCEVSRSGQLLVGLQQLPRHFLQIKPVVFLPALGPHPKIQIETIDIDYDSFRSCPLDFIVCPT